MDGCPWSECDPLKRAAIFNQYSSQFRIQRPLTRITGHEALSDDTHELQRSVPGMLITTISSPNITVLPGKLGT
jgi:hypothetical protein